MNKNPLNVFTVIVVVSLLTGCSYFQKKDCENADWFQYAKSVALNGSRLSGDQKIEACRKIEADINESQLDLGWKAGQSEYCTTQGAYRTGRQGKIFFGEICNSSDSARLLAENTKGIRDYCSTENGEELGRKGDKYASVCPTDLAPSFVAAFRKGRKAFLTKQAEQLKAEASKAQNDLRFVEGKLAGFEANLRFAEGRLSGLSTNASPAERASAQAQYDAVQNETWRVRNEKSQLESTLKRLNSQLSETEKELSTL